jgi:protein-S-isoprenylcysteine O-methyltransferase Ste14
MSGAAFALVSYVLFLLLAFVWRGWLQWRRTGDHGYRGFSGHVGSMEWFGGAALLFGGIASFFAPVVELCAPGALPTWPVSDSVRIVGFALMLLGGAFTLVAQVTMGASWRVGVDPSEATTLVTAGPFGWCRNPIFAAMLTSLLGLALAVPNVAAWLGFAAALAGIEIHVRVVEEPHLSRLHGERYRDYAARTGRFLPGVGRLARPSA